MTFRNEQAFMGSDPERSEYERLVADQGGIRAICQAATRSRQ